MPSLEECREQVRRCTLRRDAWPADSTEWKKAQQAVLVWAELLRLAEAQDERLQKRQTC